MKHCPNRGCPHYRSVRSPAEYHDEIVVCHDCGAPLVEGAVPEEAAAKRAVPAALWKRLAATLALIPAMAVLSRLPLPGVDVDAFDVYASRDGLAFFSVSRANVSVFALGLMPFVTAAAIVEIAALAVPRFRPLRAGAPGRRKLGWATLALGLVLCLNQAFTFATALGGMPDFFNGSVLITTLTLTAGTALLVGGAALLSRHGLVNGFALMLALAYGGRELGAFLQHMKAAGNALVPARALLPVAATVAAVYVVARVLVMRRPPRADLDPGPRAPAIDTYRDRGPARLDPIVRVPAAGVFPIVAAATLLALPASAASLGLPGAHDLAQALQGNAVFHVAYGGLTVVLVVLCVLWLHGTEPVARRWTRGEGAADGAAVEDAVRVELRASTRRSAILLGGAAVVCSVAKTALGDFPGALTLLGLTALGLDLVDEWRARRAHPDLVAIGSTHEIDAADVGASALAASGIPVLLRGGWSRAMLQILGPYVPIQFLVPEARAGEAAGALHHLLGDELLVAEEAPGGAPAAPKAGKRRKGRARPAKDEADRDRGVGVEGETAPDRGADETDRG